MAVILITHDLGVISEMADQVVVMYAGRIVERGPIESILGQLRHPYTRGLVNSIPHLDKRKERLSTIPGQVPDAMALPVGCKFHPRCYLMIEECKKEEPPLFQVDNEHYSRCIRWKECC
jgi:peptide/nickel transport system ATP-binding protein